MNMPRALRWRPTTTLILIISVVVLVIYSAASYVVATFRPTVSLKVGSGVYSLWVADDEAERVQGLSGVDTLSSNGGLLMKFDSSDTWGIWMRDMKVPLDILWLNEDKEVVYIVKNASPELSTSVTFTPYDKSLYVVELPAGSVAKAGIATGMKAEFEETSDGAWW